MNPIESPRAVAIFGGRFDPVHSGHVTLAEICRKHLNFATLEIVPTKNAPHKVAAVATDDERVELLKLAFKDFSGARINDWELKKDHTCYTTDLLDHYAAQGAEQPFFILGEDSLYDLPKWYQFPKLLFKARWVAVRRGTFPNRIDRQAHLLESLEKTGCQINCQETPVGVRWTISNLPNQPVNSTTIDLFSAEIPDIRSQDIRKGLYDHGGHWLDSHPVVPPAVAQYLKTHHLYVKKQGLTNGI
ncbi:MAG TPA: nicotinate-nicotinamide nucleotide adenylyltransferase [Oligoflexia bacterium]|nr:nicotinate-nicotinamide nucleotide adenylyltransferase [Oligoflexia bacterium]